MVSAVGEPLPRDRRVRRSRATMQRALVDLVSERALTDISIADVAERAGVGRSTFYDHYRDVHELAEAACTSMIEETIERLGATADGASASDEPSEALTGFFAAFADHANLYRALLGPQGSAAVINHLRRRVSTGVYRNAHPADPVDPVAGDPHDVVTAFVAGALLGVAVDWLERDCPLAPAALAERSLPLFAALPGIAPGADQSRRAASTAS